MSDIQPRGAFIYIEHKYRAIILYEITSRTIGMMFNITAWYKEMHTHKNKLIQIRMTANRSCYLKGVTFYVLHRALYLKIHEVLYNPHYGYIFKTVPS